MTDSHRVHLLWDRRFYEHRAPHGHPERPERLDAVRRGIDAAGALGVPTHSISAEDVTREALARAHTSALIERIARASKLGLDLDLDTYTSPASDGVARLAAGSAIALCEAVLGGEAPAWGFAAVRPPGHHAETDRAMGFCLYSNVAVAALDVVERGLAERVAILDWDVHHGNGTEEILRDNGDILYVSLHQYPYYPGTGAVTDVGVGRGRGRTVNLPLPAGCGDADYLHCFERVVMPILTAADPELILVSAGYDAHRRDPLGSMRLSSQAFGAMTQRMRDLDCSMAAVLEGGYDLIGLGDGVASTLRALAGFDEQWRVDDEPGLAAQRIVERVIEVQSS